jgi:hypothetical protein
MGDAVGLTIDRLPVRAALAKAATEEAGRPSRLGRHLGVESGFDRGHSG